MIGQAIKQLRKKSKLTQKQVCDRLKIPQSYLSVLENKPQNTTTDMLREIANAMGFPLCVLLYLSITEEEVKEDKLVMFRTIKPSVDDFIFSVFEQEEFKKKKPIKKRKK